MSTIQSDAAQIATTGLTAIKTAIDSIDSETVAEITPLTDDSATFAINYAESKLSGPAGSALKMILGLAGPVIAGAEAAADKAVAAELTTLGVSVDAALTGLQGKLA